MIFVFKKRKKRSLKKMQRKVLGPAAAPGPAQIREDKVMTAVRGASAVIICTASNAADLMCGRWLRRAGV